MKAADNSSNSLVNPPYLTPSAPTGRNPRGQFTAGYLGGGYLAATSHALTATTLPPALAHVRDEVAAFVAGCLVDEGDADVPTRRKALLEYRARVHRRIVQLDDAIELKGLIDKHGKLRVGWLSQLSTLIATAKGIDALLGLERRPKPTQTLDSYLRSRAPSEPVTTDAVTDEGEP